MMKRNRRMKLLTHQEKNRQSERMVVNMITDICINQVLAKAPGGQVNLDTNRIIIYNLFSSALLLNLFSIYLIIKGTITRLIES